MDTHRYRIGQTVRFDTVSCDGLIRPPAGFFRVLALMPESLGSKQYRLESTSDGHQRVATEREIDEE